MLLVCSIWCSSIGQSDLRSDLEQERNRIIQEIETASTQVKAASKDTKATLAELENLNKEISSRKSLIDNLKSQIQLSITKLEANSDSIVLLNEELARLDSSYQKVMRFAHIKSNASNKLLRLFSAENLNEALLLWRYADQFDQYVKAKREQVEHLKHIVNRKNSSLLEEQNYNTDLLKAERSNFEALAETQIKKDRLLQQLKSKEAELSQLLKTKRAERTNLNNRIETIIAAELSARAKKNNPVVATSGSKAFAKKHSIPWPVSSPTIQAKFGDQPHPSIPNVTITNNGIDILATPQSPVLASAAGTVIGVTKIPGYNLMIIIDHGQFYTVYSKLESAVAIKGQQVNQGQILGKLGNSGKLHYEVWKGQTKLNPEDWLTKIKTDVRRLESR